MLLCAHIEPRVISCKIKVSKSQKILTADQRAEEQAASKLSPDCIVQLYFHKRTWVMACVLLSKSPHALAKVRDFINLKP